MNPVVSKFDNYKNPLNAIPNGNAAPPSFFSSILSN